MFINYFFNLVFVCKVIVSRYGMTRTIDFVCDIHEIFETLINFWSKHCLRKLFYRKNNSVYNLVQPELIPKMP